MSRDPVRIARHEVTGVALEDHVTAIGGNLAVDGIAIAAAVAAGTGADQEGGVVGTIAKKDVQIKLAVGVRSQGRWPNC